MIRTKACLPKSNSQSQSLNATCKGESSTKVDRSVSVSTHHAKDLRKKRSEVKPEWRPKKKIDESTKSCFVSDSSRISVSTTDVIDHVASHKQNLDPSINGYLNLVFPDFSYADPSYMVLGFRLFQAYDRAENMLSNFIEKFCDNVRFGNDQFSPILGHEDVVQENIMIKNVSYVEGLRHNMFNIGHLCDKDLEVNFKAKRCCVRIEDDKEILVGLPELKYEREHLSDACEKGKMKRASHKPKPESSTSTPLELLHMDLCGPMRTQSINDKKLIITDNGTEFKNKTVDDYLESVEITHQLSAARTQEQNGVVERRNIKCYVLNDKESLNKFSPKAEEGIFIGYSQTSASYRVYLMDSKIVVENVNVTFAEDMASDQFSLEPVIT
ncbi:hypothetical protein L6452_18135 [Arctium lappa]|uniref:Uncharacterized protein n=1 Tax=Arctium lappa TaxID=4217 RepID=A0ACB9C5G9_ARCLA|nr:hypothetical protein L6452_18135 [Arctium lappa]